MRNAVLLFLLLSFLFGCQRNNEIRLKIKEAEELLISEKLDSAFLLLKAMTNPDALDDKTFAYWCITYSDVCEQLNEDMPFVSQMERANEYINKHGIAKERIKGLMYLGQSYKEENSFDEATETFLQAVDLAKSKREYLIVGKIYNKIAQLYDFDNNYDDAQHFHQLSGEYYFKGKDSLNYIYSIRDIGWIYTLKEEYGQASEAFLKAYRLALNLNDSLLLSSITNRLGNNYLEMGNYSLAEKYLFESVNYDETGSAPSFLALADLYISQKKYVKARHYINMARQCQISNSLLECGILYELYKLEKDLGNYTLSLDYYEQYINIEDSISDLRDKVNTLRVEKRYEYANLLNENSGLKIKNQRIVIVSFGLLLICLLLFMVYIYRVALKNKYILRQQKIIQDEHALLLDKEITLKGLSNDILKIRENILINSNIYIKIIENSQSIEKSKKYPLTDKDWRDVKEIIKSTYISFFENLHSHFTNLTEDEIRFCCLLKIGLNGQQLSILLNIQPASVIHKRYRIMKKGALENTNTTLEEVITIL